MTLYDELYFEITVCGKKRELKKFAQILLSGELDDFFPMSEDYLVYDDEYMSAGEDDKTELFFSNDELAIEIEALDPEELLEALCRNAKALEVYGQLFDADNTEYNFESPEGDSGFENSLHRTHYNDELDSVARDEDGDENEDEE